MPETVLIIDDDVQVRRLCRITLEESGYLVSEASNGKEALAAIGGTPFDLLVLDLSMPDMDGIEFLMAVRAELRKYKIIVMSGFMGGTMLPAAKHLGGAATLSKPFSPESLLSLVDEVLSKQDTPPGL
jgi:DNA-binding NtrC family response regulator